MTAVLLLDFGGGMSVNAWTFLASRLTPYWEITSPKKGFSVYLNRNSSLIHFRFACLHILHTLSNMTLWSLPSSSIPAIKMSSASLNAWGISLKNLSIFFWNLSHACSTPNGNHMYLHLPHGQENMVKYDG